LSSCSLIILAALDHAKHGIRVNCVCPTWVDTNMIKQACEDMPGLEETLAPSVPMGRIARPEEIADAIVFLSSPRASFVTGCPFIIDGGTTLTSNR
jgi:NAD(P)-dependent dehydrogenase (short-subunit alcohol dehydrogenase family)